MAEGRLILQFFHDLIDKGGLRTIRSEFVNVEPENPEYLDYNPENDSHEWLERINHEGDCEPRVLSYRDHLRRHIYPHYLAALEEYEGEMRVMWRNGSETYDKLEQTYLQLLRSFYAELNHFQPEEGVVVVRGYLKKLAQEIKKRTPGSSENQLQPASPPEPGGVRSRQPGRSRLTDVTDEEILQAVELRVEKSRFQHSDGRIVYTAIAKDLLDEEFPDLDWSQGTMRSRVKEALAKLGLPYGIPS